MQTVVATTQIGRRERVSICCGRRGVSRAMLDYACSIPNKNSDGKHTAVPIRCDVCHATFLFPVQLFEPTPSFTCSVTLHGKSVCIYIYMNRQIRYNTRARFARSDNAIQRHSDIINPDNIKIWSYLCGERSENIFYRKSNFWRKKKNCYDKQSDKWCKIFIFLYLCV